MSKRLHALYVGLFFLIGITVTLLILYDAASYYLLPLNKRFFSPLHNLYKPSGALGHGMGIIGSLMMITGVSIYMIRKRWRRVMRLGILKHWLEFHIFLCTLGPVLVLFHTALKFGGIVSLSFWSMVAVVASGFMGRFIYVRIPRTIQGQELDFKTLKRESDEITNMLREMYHVNEEIISEIENFARTEEYKNISLNKIIPIIIQDYFRGRRISKSVYHNLSLVYDLNEKATKDIMKAVDNKIFLARRLGTLRTMQKLFHYWHVFHLPFAIIMFVVMFIHVGITITFGYKWIF